ncbi:MAG: efflux RND transporter permease subunit [Acetobacteraceae bacterium]|nr:efflux RND transporter permease subunit [Acetobacteraceae bacterium]
MAADMTNVYLPRALLGEREPLRSVAQHRGHKEGCEPMWLVKYALKFRNSFYVLAVLILLGSVGASTSMKEDVLPQVDIPVVAVVCTYTGLNAKEMESRVTT